MQIPVYIGSSLSLLSAAVVFFLVPNINANWMAAEDERFRGYLEEAGYDTSIMGIKPLLDAETLNKKDDAKVTMMETDSK